MVVDAFHLALFRGGWLPETDAMSNWMVVDSD